MKIEVNVNKKYFIAFLGAILIGFGIFAVYALQPAPNPGHHAEEIGAGAFFGDVNSIWTFPGKVGIGTSNPQRSLHVATDTSVIFEGTNRNAPQAPAISLRERDLTNPNGLNPDHWEIIKRGSNYGSEQDNLIFAHFSDETNFIESLRLTPNGETYVDGQFCLNNDCKSAWPTTTLSGMPIGTWCGREWRNGVNNVGVPCTTFHPADFTNSCPPSYTKTQVGTEGSNDVYSCIKTS